MREARFIVKPDAVVFWVCICAAAFVLGMEYGIDEAKNKLATQCIPQQGEKELLSTVQERTSVHCIYSINGYGLAKAKRRAT